MMLPNTNQMDLLRKYPSTTRASNGVMLEYAPVFQQRFLGSSKEFVSPPLLANIKMKKFCQYGSTEF
jgi:hypothetical protein